MTTTSSTRAKRKTQPTTVGAASTSKLETLIALLKRTEGARLDEMMSATGWQAHSVRGALSGALKKHRKLAVTSENTEAGRVYRIENGAGA